LALFALEVGLEIPGAPSANWPPGHHRCPSQNPRSSPPRRSCRPAPRRWRPTRLNLDSFPSRASPGRVSLPQDGTEESERGEERAQGPPGEEEAEAGSETVAGLEERGEE